MTIEQCTDYVSPPPKKCYYGYFGYCGYQTSQVGLLSLPAYKFRHLPVSCNCRKLKRMSLRWQNVHIKFHQNTCSGSQLET